MHNYAVQVMFEGELSFRKVGDKCEITSPHDIYACFQ